MSDRLVYFIQAVQGGPIKIGSAVDPDERLRTLQTGSPFRLVIRKVRRGGYRVENGLHRRFAEHRLWGEWFAPCEELVRLCRGLPAADAGLESARREGFEAGYLAADDVIAKLKRRIESLEVDNELLDMVNEHLEALLAGDDPDAPRPTVVLPPDWPKGREEPVSS